MDKEDIIKKITDCENVYIEYDSRWWEIDDIEKDGENIILHAGDIIID